MTRQGLCTPSVKTIPFQGQLGQCLRRCICLILRSPNPAPQGRKKTEAGRQFLWLSRTQLLAADQQSSSHGAPPLSFRDVRQKVVLAPGRQPCPSPPASHAWGRVSRLGAVCPDWESLIMDTGRPHSWGTQVCLGDSVFTSILSSLCQSLQTSGNRNEEVTGLKVMSGLSRRETGVRVMMAGVLGGWHRADTLSVEAWIQKRRRVSVCALVGGTRVTCVSLPPSLETGAGVCVRTHLCMETNPLNMPLSLKAPLLPERLDRFGCVLWPSPCSNWRQALGIQRNPKPCPGLTSVLHPAFS